MLLIDHFERTASTAPERPFIHYAGERADDDRAVDYGGADRIASAIASALRKRGAGKGSVVALYLPNSPEWLLWYIACQKIGAVACGINTTLSEADIALSLADVAPTFIVASAETARPAARVARGLASPAAVLNAGLGDAGQDPVRRDLGLEPEDLVSIIFTSGTTGVRPKAVMVPNTHLVNGIAAYQEVLRFTPADRIMIVTPLFHGAALNWAVTLAILSGGALALTPRFSASRFWDQAERAGMTVLWTMGAIINILLARPADDAERRASANLHCIYGNSTLARWKEVRDRWGAVLYDGFGMSETPGTLTDEDSVDTDEPYPCVGRAVRDVDLRILDSDGDHELGPRETGEIVVRFGDGFAGYLNNPEAMREAVRGGWFRTGDLGYLDESGRLFFVDRKKDIIRRGGENISARQVELHLLRHPDIAEAAAVAKPDPIFGEVVCAYLVPKRPGHRFDGKAIRVFCAEALPDYMVPEDVRTADADSLPRTPTGRIQKFRLKMQLRAECGEADT